jgi:NADH:ubiquinone oxidoreductase subunit E
MNQIDGRTSERQEPPLAALLSDGDGDGPDRLIEVLQQLQERQGSLDRRSLRRVAQRLQLSDSRVFGVVSFYHLFRRTPPRLHGCRLCQGTACVVQGGWELRRQLEEELTASDWDLALESCLGVCGQAPLLLLDGVLVGRLPVHDRDAVRSELQRRGVPMQAGGITP